MTQKLQKVEKKIQNMIKLNIPLLKGKLLISPMELGYRSLKKFNIQYKIVLKIKYQCSVKRMFQ